MASRIASIAIALLGFSSGVHADIISDWNEKVVGAGAEAKQAAFAHTRSVAILHLAMFEAANAIEPRYRPYRIAVTAPAGASMEAAAGSAAHLVLVRLYPDQARSFDTFHAASLAAIPDGETKVNGIRVGEQVADELLALRAKDGADAPNRYRPHTTPGAYVPTVFPVATAWAKMTPFALMDASQFRPAAPYSLKSEEWARDCNEVRRMGARVGSERTPQQTEIAHFWEATGPALHNPVLRQLAVTRRMDVLDTARLYALYSMAMADSYIAVFDAKYTYNFWRPVTAIRNGEMSGNVGIHADDAWEPLITTPMHPEYPCAHCINSAAAAAVLAGFFGDAVSFTMRSPSAAGITRRFSRLSDYAQESIDARVYDGVHYRTSGEVGAAMGRKIAEYVLQTQLRPMR